ncbi:hypothetical protein Psed_5814 [Pseudonocardia dioxanivorans CB1190]|uniref:Peptidase C51 domain-containing protein n=1 Tax=Pseudonocardia dioxanivorans (strain ATCC 55486 / DSM 44775 / JCM 13855 / CB1190) TaxID=675635 RepID=F4D1F1_PSEUX|nr:CHAP domain-containing protein [Pseudonocardia dioxanivorans]AEA27939.1 hypothetical protein Psed_5814 [Pseudonocardia dioxanivorans CB1190]
MPTADQVLDVARSQIGTVENARGEQPYGAFYGLNGPAWCAMFQYWCFSQVPGGAALIPKTAYTPTFYQWFVDRRQSSRTPVKGALVFYDWPDSVPRIQHVGIVEAVNPDGSITTIEGNTTSGQAGDQSNGGGVWRRRRTTSAVVGYGLPAYDRTPLEDDMPLTDADAELVAKHVWDHMIYNNWLGREEWARTVLGAEQDRVIRQNIAPLQGELDALKAAVAALASGRAPADPGAAVPVAAAPVDLTALAAAVADELQARLSRKE